MYKVIFGTKVGIYFKSAKYFWCTLFGRLLTVILVKFQYILICK
jgi:hypothetical protein